MSKPGSSLQEQLIHPAAATSDGSHPSTALLGEDEDDYVDPARCCACLLRFRRSVLSVTVVVALAVFVDLFVYCVIIPVRKREGAC